MFNKKYKVFIVLTIIFFISPIISYSIDFNLDDYLNHKCGTFKNYKNQNKPKIQDFWPLDSVGKPLLQAYTFSKKRNFCVHYDTVNISPDTMNAVSTVDNDQNGVPDYVDSVCYYFEYALHVYLDSMGYKSPIIKGGKGYIDVYLTNIGNGTYQNAEYGVTNPDSILYQNYSFQRCTSYIIIDNDFGIKDSIQLPNGVKIPTYKEFGIKAMRITATHELHHVIQYIYGPDPNTPLLNEFTSTYMEYRVFPDTKDYEQFLVGLFKDLSKYPFGNGEQNGGYRWAIFGQYIYKHFGDELLKRMWELQGEQIEGYKALDSAFVERGSSLAVEWCNFMPWLYFTGPRTIADSFFVNAKEFPLLTPYNDSLTFSPPSLMFGGSLNTYEVRFLRCIFPPPFGAIIDFILSNHDTYSAITQPQTPTLKDYYFTFTENQTVGFTQIDDSRYYYSLILPQDNICPFLNLIITEPITYAYPNPYKPSIDKDGIKFPVPSEAPVGTKAYLRILNAALLEVYARTEDIIPDNNLRVVQCNDLPSNLDSGVYLFSVKYENYEFFGKFTIIR